MTAPADQLFATCVLPGCDHPVPTVGEPCDGCVAAFGPMLRTADRPAITAAQITERDAAVAAAYRRQRELPERKANQRCWPAVRRPAHLHTRASSGWECDTCLEVP